jgi:hypothetical protein
MRMGVSIWVVVRYLLGHAAAIREIATNRAALWTGIVLVLLTGIARNYDQNYALETPVWLIGPLVFSLFSGSFVYVIVVCCFAKRHLPQTPTYSQWPTFMSLFWMTAPIAWLYAIPVERFFESYQAAQANLALLAVVSTWRVLLMSRALSVLFEVKPMRAFGWVLLAATLETIIVVFLGSLFSPTFGRRVMAAMGGMRNAPEENLLSAALFTVWGWSWIVLLIVFILLAALRFRGTVKALPSAMPGKTPWIALACLTAFWVLIAIPAQQEQYRFRKHSALLNRGRYEEALTYLGKYAKRDFPAARRLEPNPYEYRVWAKLPPTVALLTTNTPGWIREVYLSHAAVMFRHPYSSQHAATNIAKVYSAIERLPEGRNWVKTNQTAVEKRITWLAATNASLESNASTSMMDTPRQTGTAATNVARALDNP